MSNPMWYNLAFRAGWRPLNKRYVRPATEAERMSGDVGAQNFNGMWHATTWFAACMVDDLIPEPKGSPGLKARLREEAKGDWYYINEETGERTRANVPFVPPEPDE